VEVTSEDGIERSNRHPAEAILETEKSNSGRLVIEPANGIVSEANNQFHGHIPIYRLERVGLS